MMHLIRSFLLLLASLVLTQNVSGQCDTWNDKANKEDLLADHTVYRGFIKEGNLDAAFPYWERVYSQAPAANGKITLHFYDGQQLYIHKFKNAASDAEKDTYRQKALEVFDQEAACKGNVGTVMGRKGYHMFYDLATPYPDTYQALKTGLDAAGTKSEYIILVPMAYVLVDQFKNKRISIEEARDVFTRLVEVADQNIATNKTYAAQYQQGKDAMMPTLAEIEGDLFDCAWFKKKLEPEYRANPDDGEKLKVIYLTLSGQGCPENDPLLVEIKAKYEAYAAEVNAKKLQEFYAANPGAHAKALFDEGKYNEAVVKYNEALQTEQDKDKQADYYQALASIHFRHLNKLSAARDYARKALKLRPNWGQPLILIGDMYAKSYRSCGSNDFEQRCVILAAMEKYYEAKAIDDSVADQVNERISRFMGSRPSYEDGHMMGLTEGSAYKVGCWIGETVTLRFNK